MSPGQLVLVTFGGGWGTQLAHLLTSDQARDDGRVLVEKFRMQGRKWTRPTLISSLLIVGDTTVDRSDLAEMIEKAAKRGAFDTMARTKARAATSAMLKMHHRYDVKYGERVKP